MINQSNDITNIVLSNYVNIWYNNNYQYYHDTRIITISIKSCKITD